MGVAVLLPLSLTVLFLVQPAAPAAAPAPAAPAAAPAGIEWKDFGPGLAAAKKVGKPVLVQFFATWCGYCRRMEATTFKNAAVIADLQKAAVTVRVDGEEAEPRDGYRGADLADKYGVRLFPTHVLLDGEGRVVAKAPGFMEPQAFLSWFKLSVAKAYQQSALPPTPPSGS